MATEGIKKHVAANGQVSWRIRVELPPNPVTGKRCGRMLTFRTEAEAKTARAAWTTEIERGTAVDPSKMTVGEYLLHWLEADVRPRVRPATYSGYERLIRVQLIPRIGAKPLQKLHALHIKECYARMRSEPRADGRDGELSARSIRYAHTVLKMALKEALRTHLVARNVAGEVDPPKAVRPKIEYWGREEAWRFLEVADADPYRALWHVAMNTGMRKSELLGLRWCDVDMTRGAVRVQQQHTKVQGQPGERATRQTSDPKSDSGHRTITVPAACVAILREHAAALPIPIGHAGRGLVFTGPDGQPLVHETITDRFDRLVARAGVKRITFHGMRHTHATLLLLAGVNVKAVSVRLGHSSIQITLDTYAHVLPEMEQQAAEAIGQALARQA